MSKRDPDSTPAARTRTNDRLLLDGDVGRTMLRLAFPSMLGIAAILMFMLVDTFFVGQLGPRPLAAMGFIYPVSFTVMSVAIGLGIGTTAVVSRAIGAGEKERARRITTDSLILGVISVVCIAAFGLLTLRPTFLAIGADPEMLPLIADFMIPWYFGVGFLVIPMMGNSALRATGDTKTPAVIMILSGLINVVLDPVLIFGWGPIPAYGIAGAAYATVIAWVVVFCLALWILGRRARLLTKVLPTLRELTGSWRAVLYVGLPAAITNALIPLSDTLVTRIISEFGIDAVAAYGVGGRLYSLAMVGAMALATAATPMAGQNLGAGRLDRVRLASRFGLGACLVWGAGVAGILWLAAGGLAVAFSPDPDVQRIIETYLTLVPITYGCVGVSVFASSMLNGMNHPIWSAFLILLRFFVFTVPFVFVGARVFGLEGTFLGISVSNVLAAAAAYAALRLVLKRREEFLRNRSEDGALAS